jgi:hypothetical protein
MSYEFVRPESYWHEKARQALREANVKILRLNQISQRQSAMLAQALKEKNDLLNKDKGYQCQYERGHRESQELLKRTQLDLSAAQSQLRDIKTLATNFFRALGVS